mmetsp:Transcript_14225/g.28379  ORF Transcript_14225/g.28379 Transcript_14225/m.28379 type:complete len:522 (+) Transcript_14225:113-1678(+)
MCIFTSSLPLTDGPDMTDSAPEAPRTGIRTSVLPPADGFHVTELLQPVHAALPPVPARLHPPERSGPIDPHAVHLHHSRPHRPRHPAAAFWRAAVHVVGQAVGRVVGDLQRLFLRIEGHHAEDRPEYLLAHDLHVVVDVREHRGAHVESSGVGALRPAGPAGYEPSPLLHARQYVLLYRVELRGVHHRPEVVSRGVRRAHRVCQRDPLGDFHGAVVHVPLHEQARGRVTRLPRVLEAALHDLRDVLLQIVPHVGEDHGGALPAELQADLLEGVGPRPGHGGTGAGGAGEGHHVHVRVGGEELPRPPVAAAAGDQVKRARREPRVVHHFGEQQRREGGGLGRLQHTRAADGQRRDHLEHHLVHRPVPRRDERRHAHRLHQNRRGVHQNRRGAPPPGKWELKTLQRRQKVVDVVQARAHLGFEREVDWRAHLRADRAGHLLLPPDVGVTKTRDVVAADGRSYTGPTGKRTARGGDSRVYVGSTARINGGGAGAGGGIDHDYRGDSGVRRPYPLAPDVEIVPVG